jgi:magnesium chelatase subunit H
LLVYSDNLNSTWYTYFDSIYRDSFANVVDLLDDMFERAARADEPVDLNFIRKHSEELLESGVTERSAARLFSNP